MIKKIDIKILNKNTKNKFHLPKYTTSGSSALDLRACINNIIKLKSNQTKLIPTGIAIHIMDPNIAAIIVPRSGLGHHSGIILGNSIGIIDSDYQGELMLSIWNRKKHNFFIKPNSRIAQIIFIPIIKIKFNIVNSFQYTTKRKKKGFGHSGTS
ncbi:Deoxyuridine 5'-triphosphate nucleotidohydrolase [Candidatus Westeberhardia cardiocondylae]|uniref:dUTP diphosphatase n=1 Tax=Candidatus Westeberhardia cardiocondylae TaxID=1594731 RepID=A0A0H5BWJ6_9ENTR|nr:dUTP diphosphatase [Candidatus Westeberhardia cardiocondylae]CEN32008.1 Deoxyuridine 5'-triphosphate nucleotidohydrolase [Candidatus Westeberhardia cardiocondylae]